MGCGLEAIWLRPNTSKPTLKHKIYARAIRSDDSTRMPLAHSQHLEVRDHFPLRGGRRYFRQQVLQAPVVEHCIRQQPLEPSVLFLERLQPIRIADRKT